MTKAGKNYDKQSLTNVYGQRNRLNQGTLGIFRQIQEPDVDHPQRDSVRAIETRNDCFYALEENMLRAP